MATRDAESSRGTTGIRESDVGEEGATSPVSPAPLATASTATAATSPASPEEVAHPAFPKEFATSPSPASPEEGAISAATDDTPEELAAGAAATATSPEAEEIATPAVPEAAAATDDIASIASIEAPEEQSRSEEKACDRGILLASLGYAWRRIGYGGTHVGFILVSHERF